MTFRRIAVALATALATIVVAAVPANASTVWNEKYATPSGTFAGTYTWIDCGTFDQTSYYKCRSGVPDSQTSLSDYGNDGRPSRLRIWAYINGSWNLRVSLWVGNGNSYTLNLADPPRGVKMRFKACIYKADYSTVVRCETKYGKNSY